MIERLEVIIQRDGIEHEYSLTANPGYTVTIDDIENINTWLRLFGIGSHPTDVIPEDEPLVPMDSDEL